MSSICGFRTKANNEDILRGKEETGSQWEAWKSPQIAPQVEFCENAKYWELRPDSARSAEIPQNPSKCKSAGRVLHKSNTASNFFQRDERVAAWQSQVGKSQSGEKLGLRPIRISIDQPMFSMTWRGCPCILTFWDGFFECRRRFGAISLNLASAAEESGSIPGSPTSWIGSGSRRDCSNKVEHSVEKVKPDSWIRSIIKQKRILFLHLFIALLWVETR